MTADRVIVDRAVGIDLGTTNSEIALLDPSERDVIVWADRFGRATLPSAVAWDPATSALVVGRAARARRGQLHAPVESIKRRMGQATTFEVGPNVMSPEDVSAAILGELRRSMHELLNARAPAGLDAVVERAVITVPAYFDAPQIEATRRAGVKAGLEVLGILHEPTAAAIHQQWKRGRADGTFLVYDLGGGTFDVSVLRLEHGEHQVLAIDGDNFLGGDDLDRRFAERLRRMLVERGARLELDPLSRPDDAARWMRLVFAAQEIKEALSTQPVVSFAREALLVDTSGVPISVDLEIGREEWEEATRALLDVTIEACERALAQSHARAGVGIEDIDHVILVGGSTRAPSIVARVTEALASRTRGKDVWQSDVDTCVAQGAAIHAASIGGLVLCRASPRAGAAERPTARVRVSGSLVTSAAALRLAVEILDAPAETVRLSARAKGVERASAAVGVWPSPAPLRLETALDDAEETPLELALMALGGDVLTSVPLTVYRGVARPRPSALSQPVVVAKDLSIEIKRGGLRERRVLVPAGASLPVRAEASLATGDASGTVVFRILSGRLPIETLSLEVPKDLAVGTPVSLSLEVDAAHRIEARATVAGRELWAKIEPVVRALPTSVVEIEGLLEEAESVKMGLWGRHRDEFARTFEPIATNLRETLGTDPEKLAALTATLRTLLQDVRGREGGGLSPTWDRFVAWLDAVRRIAYRTEGELIGVDAAGWALRLDALTRRGRVAFDAEDAAAWRRAANEAQALYETALTHGSALISPDDPATLRIRLGFARREVSSLERALLDLVLSASPDVRRAQEAQRSEIALWIATQRTALFQLEPSEVAPQDLRRALEAARAALERIEGAIERLPTLGLVTEPRGRT